MLTLKGQVLNCFTVPPSEKYPEASHKVQFLGDNVTKDGQIRNEMVTLTVPLEFYLHLEKRVGNAVQIPVGVFAEGKTVRMYFPKGHVLHSPEKEG